MKAVADLTKLALISGGLSAVSGMAPDDCPFERDDDRERALCDSWLDGYTTMMLFLKEGRS